MASATFTNMSLADIKEELKLLPRDERLSLAEYLWVLNRIEEPEVLREVDEAMARMDAGEKYTLADLETAEEQLRVKER